MLVERFVCGRSRSNTYVFAPGDDGRCVIVDAGPGAAARVAGFVRSRDLRPEAVLLTHGHPDHTWSARALCLTLGVRAWLHTADAGWLDDPASGRSIPLIRFAGRCISTVRRIRPDELEPITGDCDLELAGVTITVRHTPGHTPGSVCLIAGGVCFSGDTAFATGPGHTIYPGGDRQALRRSIRDGVLTLPDDVRLFPGHGAATTIGAARAAFGRLVGR